MMDVVSLNMSSSVNSEESSWITWFCSIKGNEFFCEIDEEYIQDKFNLTGITDFYIPHYQEALDIILNNEEKEYAISDDWSEGSALASTSVDEAAAHLYGLIHARYILTTRGLSKVLKKYLHGHFGTCPRVFCEKQNVLPIGMSDAPGEQQVKVYCPRCKDVYQPRVPRHGRTDGAYFGTGGPNMLFMVHPQQRPAPPRASHTPALYGFRLHTSALPLQHEAASKAASKAAVDTGAAFSP